MGYMTTSAIPRGMPCGLTHLLKSNEIDLTDVNGNIVCTGHIIFKCLDPALRVSIGLCFPSSLTEVVDDFGKGRSGLWEVSVRSCGYLWSCRAYHSGEFLMMMLFCSISLQ